MPKKTIEGVIFDLDGTLFDLDVDWPALKTKIGAYLGRTIGSLNEIYREKELMRGEVGDMIDSAEEAGRLTGKVLPGVMDMLTDVAERYKLAVVTRNGTKASTAVLSQLGLDEVVLVSRDDVTQHKPHPEAIEVALEKLGLKAEAVVVVGDSMHDVDAAHALNIRAIAVPSPQYPTPTDADYYIETMAQLPATLATIEHDLNGERA